jgi:ribonucleoside-diphosphate reductase alpha chain
MQAYDTGCKGCTTYRPNEVTGSVLSVASEEKPKSEKEIDGEVIYMSEPLERPNTLDGNTYKLRWPDSEHAIYVTINDIIVNDQRRPFEVFINSKNMEHFAWTVGLTRMISAVFRRGGDVSFVVDELKAVFDPRGGAWVSGKYIPSILAAIGGILEEHMVKIGFITNSDETLSHQKDDSSKVEKLKRFKQKSCTSCGQFDLQMIEGCMTCRSCGYSKCG